MRAMKVSSWDGKKGPLTEDAIRGMFRPEYCYRIFRREFPEAAAFAGEAEERTLVLLQGKCVMMAGGQRHTLQPGDIAEVPAGEFLFECEGPVAFLAVYKLPPELWPN